MSIRTGVMIGAVAVTVTLGAFLMMPVGGDLSNEVSRARDDGREPFRAAAEAPAAPVDLAFLHHSVGTQLLAAPGPENGQRDGVPTHPNGGGLAALLAASNYRLHEATYGSSLGEHTDLFDWLPKFRAHMPDILAIRHQDERLPEGQRNRVVMFKSCYPNNQFVGAGSGSGSPAGPELTEANARATMAALLEEMAKYPDTLFVYVTAPPVAPHTWSEPRWKQLAKQVLGRPTHEEEFRESGAMARRFNEWVTSPDGWRRGYAGRNVTVFDLYGELTDGSPAGFSRYPSGDGTDSHPSSAGNARVAPMLVSFLNAAVRQFETATAPSGPPTL
ncbi:MAG: SGNH/GDSL hydrolase family protein [Vicinamibacterales bacterium]|nr:SGNH/GDSL hydrolase family protein [Vicinamibacterales bacterium]